MLEINISTLAVNSKISCGKGVFEQFTKSFNSSNAFLVTDSNVYSLYSDLIKSSFPEAQMYCIKAGEKSKNYNVLLGILKAMAASGLTRNGTVIAFGGGVVGDITGLAASLYMRGVKLVQIPTTLLSQVDSSVGGKTAIDLSGIKNVVGTFYQPSRVIVDPVFLATLSAREIRCGLGEIVKYGALNAKIFELLCKNSKNLSDFTFLEQVTPLCIQHKADVVATDERDLGGARKSLNLGHTTGHAFELYYKRKSHGEFVLIGAYYELFIAKNFGVCDESYCFELKSLIKKVIKSIPAFENVGIAAQTAKFDKKNAAQTEVSLIVPASVGEYKEIKLSLGDYVKQTEQCAEMIRCGQW